MNTTDMNNIRKILFAIYRNNPVEIKDEKRVGYLNSYDVINGNIEVRFPDGSLELTNIEQCRIILKAEDIPMHMNIYRQEQIKEFTRMRTAEEIEKGEF